MSNDNLKRLKGADRIRKQVNVDLGSNDILGVQQGLFEIVSNSIDRFRRGFGNYVEVIKNKDLSYEVRDYADGLPMDWNEDEQAYNWELAMRVPCAGGNYDHDSESLGQHGKGLSATLLSSKNVKVISFKNGYRYEVNMFEGRPLHKKTFDFICDELNISRPTATSYLNKLVDNGFLAKMKLGRDNFYLNMKLFDLLLNAFHIDKPVSNQQRISTLG